MSGARSLHWLASHEGRLAWRDLHYLVTAGHRWRLWQVGTTLLVAFAVFHFLAFWMVRGYATVTAASGPSVLATITGSLILSFCLMVSQALEQVTRLFYGRGDLDLLKSSPVSLRRVFALRVASIAVTTTAMTLVVATPFINVLILQGGLRWIAGFGVAVAIGMAASGLSLALTVALFNTLGPKRTRLASQIVAAVVGSAFIIGIQAAAIMSLGTISQQTFFSSDVVIAHIPPTQSLLWIPARALLGDVPALAVLLAAGAGTLVLPLVLFRDRLSEFAVAAAGTSQQLVRRGVSHAFRSSSPRGLLWRKEWVLLLRDPWLASQSLLQLLYLMPPALLVWKSYGESRGALAVLAPILTMAAGQLAGGLAWLAVSGEDAPDLIASAPILPSTALVAKTQAVMIAVGAIFAPFMLAVIGLSLPGGLVIVAGISISALSSTLIQIWFRRQAQRRYFRHRQTSSRIATFAEALSSACWAVTAAVAVNYSWLAIMPAAMAGFVLGGAWLLRPR